jgi:hypothetical protein
MVNRLVLNHKNDVLYSRHAILYALRSHAVVSVRFLGYGTSLCKTARGLMFCLQVDSYGLYKTAGSTFLCFNNA